MAKTITITQADFDKRAKDIAQKSFMLGVDWLLKVLVKSDVWDSFDEHAAGLYRKQAEKIIGGAIE